MSLITAGHCETETPSMPVLAKFIKDEFLDIEVTFLDSFPTTLVNDEN
jgi:putative NIF3 family GTP cyclohydrolase 1 type 2